MPGTRDPTARIRAARFANPRPVFSIGARVWIRPRANGLCGSTICCQRASPRNSRLTAPRAAPCLNLGELGSAQPVRWADPDTPDRLRVARAALDPRLSVSPCDLAPAPLFTFTTPTRGATKRANGALPRSGRREEGMEGSHAVSPFVIGRCRCFQNDRNPNPLLKQATLRPPGPLLPKGARDGINLTGTRAIAMPEGRFSWPLSNQRPFSGRWLTAGVRAGAPPRLLALFGPYAASRSRRLTGPFRSGSRTSPQPNGFSRTAVRQKTHNPVRLHLISLTDHTF